MTRLFRRGIAALIAVLWLCEIAQAQNNWPTPGGAQANGVVQMCLNSSSQAVPCSGSGSGSVASSIVVVPSSDSTSGITPVVSAAAENNHVLKATPGNLYSVYAVNLTSTPGYLVVLNTTASPGDGAITPLDCAPLPASGSASINFGAGPPNVYSTGITAVITSAATCFTKTTGVITGFISGRVK